MTRPALFAVLHDKMVWVDWIVCLLGQELAGCFLWVDDCGGRETMRAILLPACATQRRQQAGFA